MYLADFAIENESWSQAVAALTYPREHGAGAERWWTQFRAALNIIEQVPKASTSLRIRFHQKLHIHLLMMGPGDAQQLRRAVGALTRLDAIGNGGVEFAADRTTHDGIVEFPPVRCRVSLPPFFNGDVWFAVPFLVQPFLNDLLTEAAALEHAFSYQLSVEPYSFPPAWQRETALNALRVSQLPGVPGFLDRHQQALVTKVRSAAFVCEEYVGVATDEARAWLTAALAARLRSAYGQVLVPDFTFESGGHEASLTLGRHQAFFEPADVRGVAGYALTAQERTDLLAWRPAPDVRSLMASEESEGDSLVSPVAAMPLSGPAPYAGSGSYVFVSYKREDFARISPLLEQLASSGQGFWYDREIPGGAEWDALIEEKIAGCEVLVVFLSQAAVKSKYVRREVKFADTLNKPIVGVRLENPLELADGMAMLLNQYQVINDAASLATEINRAVRYVRLL